MSTSGLDELRARGMRLLVVSGWTATLGLFLVAKLLDLNTLVPALPLSAMINVLPTQMVIRNRHDGAARLVVGIMTALHPALFVYLMQDHPWQMDMHMYFFVGLAFLAVLCDWRPIVLASVIIALHHLLLEFLAPEWVFTGRGNLDRVMIHALAVVLQCGALSYITGRLRDVIIGQSEGRAHSDRLAAEATAARERSETAQAAAEQALAAAAAAEQRAGAERLWREETERTSAASRQADLMALATEFERSVSGVAGSVGAAASNLDGLARRLNGLASETGQQAAEAAATATQASGAVRAVATGVTSLSRSIADIAVNVKQQAELSTTALDNTGAGDEAVRALAERAANIRQFVHLIQTVASQTNLLAINATIEAARAGEAGRGFAVVATEVKTLAGQAQKASSEITDLISYVRTGASDAEGALRDVSGAVDALAQAADAIRASIEQQRTAAAQIEYNADDIATGATAMARQIDRVAHTASAAEAVSGQVQDAAGALMLDAGTLQEATARFIAYLRAA